MEPVLAFSDTAEKAQAALAHGPEVATNSACAEQAHFEQAHSPHDHLQDPQAWRSEVFTEFSAGAEQAQAQAALARSPMEQMQMTLAQSEAEQPQVVWGGSTGVAAQLSACTQQDQAAPAQSSAEQIAQAQGSGVTAELPASVEQAQLQIAMAQSPAVETRFSACAEMAQVALAQSPGAGDVHWLVPWLNKVNGVVEPLLRQAIESMPIVGRFSSHISSSIVSVSGTVVSTSVHMLLKLMMKGQWWQNMHTACHKAWVREEGVVKACLAYAQVFVAYFWETVQQVVERAMARHDMTIDEEDAEVLRSLIDGVGQDFQPSLIADHSGIHTRLAGESN